MKSAIKLRLVLFVTCLHLTSASAASSSAADETNAACARIANEITRLLAAKNALQRSYWTPDNQLAAIGATTFTYAAIPSVIYLGATGLERLPHSSRRVAIQAQLVTLRQASADAMCYVEPIYHY